MNVASPEHLRAKNSQGFIRSAVGAQCFRYVLSLSLSIYNYIIIYIYICKHICIHVYNRRKFRSETSDNMDS